MRLHDFDIDITGMELPQQFTFPFHYTPHPLCVVASRQVQQYVSSRLDWAEELDKGKMLGVMVVMAPDATQPQFLAAFSGNLAGSNDHAYFVPAVYDLLNPDGEFKQGEADITAINHRIAALKSAPNIIKLREQLATMGRQGQQEIAAYKQLMAESKAQRDTIRSSSQLTNDENERLLNESRYQKAELKRLRQRIEGEIDACKHELALHENEIAQLKTRRKTMSEALQERIFRLFVVEDARGNHSDLTDIFAAAQGKLPPSGSGECCAPKLLHYAYTHHLQPLCMAEFWWGASPVGEVRHHGHFYPACHSKCKPILEYMLQGLDVEENKLAQVQASDGIEELYDDEWLTVVNKPSGMLSVPGKLLDDSALTRWQERHPEASGPMVVHRLDQETSGLLIFTKDKDTHKALQEMFAQREVHKCYLALLEGKVEKNEGDIELPLCPNIDDRPRQMVSYELGKPSVTHYEVVSRTRGKTLVRFYPKTGRTHQLRVHASHPQGLNAPIVGDMLYGKADKRLMLHAYSITFTHPATSKEITITSPCELE